MDRHEWVTQPHLKNMEDYELMTNRVEWAYPTQTREFVALDIVDKKRKILISKSSLHPDRPGGSRYQMETELDETEFVRAVQYYASKVEPLPDGKCLLRMVTWGEMCDSYTAFWVNKFNAHVFITPKFNRFRCVPSCAAIRCIRLSFLFLLVRGGWPGVGVHRTRVRYNLLVCECSELLYSM